MITLIEKGAYLVGGNTLVPADNNAVYDKETSRKNTIAYSILTSHNTSGDEAKLKIKFDKLVSHDITYVGIIQTARASGMTAFPLPYVLTNCHNSLGAVGGTINEDDHMFGLTCARKYGGAYVPPHQAVIHQYAREMMAVPGKMILGSDSHTRYGALGTMAMGEGGPELVKQLLGQTYDINMPDVVLVYLTGGPRHGVGPQDVALALIGAVFEKGFVKNKVLEFAGPGLANLSADFRIGIDVMTTETTCLSSIWAIDETIREFYEIHGRAEDYREAAPGETAFYDSAVIIDLDKIKPMIAMPFHPSFVYAIDEVNENPGDILGEVEKRAALALEGEAEFHLRNKIRNGAFHVDQGIIAGCAGGGFENICASADILRNQTIGSGGFSLSIYPASVPIYMELMRNGSAEAIMASGAIMKTAFCGPCFGAGDTPPHNAISIRHSTRNFPNREGSKPQNGQVSSVALMDARSIAATAIFGGKLTSAATLDIPLGKYKYFFSKDIYDKRVLDATGNPDPGAELHFGPGIKDWPRIAPLPEHLLLKVVSYITDPVTTTDELIPSGETSSYRSNPLGLAEYTLSRKDPAYVGLAKEVRVAEEARASGKDPATALPQLAAVMATIKKLFPEADAGDIGIGSTIYAVKPGDGSAREQAASCQRVLGGAANISHEYATKRYRSNLINWGMLPFVVSRDEVRFQNQDFIFIPNIRRIIETEAFADSAEKKGISCHVIRGDEQIPFSLSLGELTGEERQIILKGCLINYNQVLPFRAGCQ